MLSFRIFRPSLEQTQAHFPAGQVRSSGRKKGMVAFKDEIFFMDERGRKMWSAFKLSMSVGGYRFPPPKPNSPPMKFVTPSFRLCHEIMLSSFPTFTSGRIPRL